MQPPLHREIRQRQEQRELVGGDEAPVGQKPLHAEEELDLVLGLGPERHFPAR